MSDFSRFTSAQVREHVAFNQRSVRLQPELFDRGQRVSLAQARQHRESVDAQIRAFHQWRIGYVGPRRERITSSEADTAEAIAMAHRALEQLQRTWNAVTRWGEATGEAGDLPQADHE